MVDYSKWKNIEISDDEDDTHPNIDTPSLYRWRHQARVERMAELEREKEELKKAKQTWQARLIECKESIRNNDGNEEDLNKQLEKLEEEGKDLGHNEEELMKKERKMPWNVDTISKPGFAKTVLNRQISRKTVDNITEEEKEAKMRKFVKENEKLCKQYGMMRKYDDSRRFLQEHLDLVCEETANYLVIWSINLEMEEKHELMAHVAHQCICMQYILELAKQLDVDPRACLASFFSKIQNCVPEYRQQFESEIEAFKQRIKKRAQEKIQVAMADAEEEERKERLGPGGLDPVEIFESLPDMFSLVKFHNDKLFVAESKNVQKIEGKSCIVKCKGGKYSAFLVSKSDNKSKVIDVKRKMEEKLTISSKNKRDKFAKITNKKARDKKHSGWSSVHDTNLPINSPSKKKMLNPSLNVSPRKGSVIASEKSVSCYTIKNVDKIDNSLEVTFDEIELEVPETSSFSSNIIDSNNEETVFKTEMTLTSKHFNNSISLNTNHARALDQIGYDVLQSSSFSNSATSTHSNNETIAHQIDVKKTLEPSNITHKTHHNSTTLSEIGLSQNNFSEINTEQIAAISPLENYKPLEEGSKSVDVSDIIDSNRSIGLSDISLSHKNLSEVSSEYIPDFSSFEISKTVTEKNESVDVVDVPLNVKEICVPYSESKTKKHFCIFCKTLQCKIARHIFLKHMDKHEVKRASALPKKSKERLKIIEELRKKGDFLHNTSANYNSGVLIVTRQQQKRFKHNVDDYICCKHCKGFFSKRTSRNHISVCGKSKGKRCNFIESRRLTQYIHSAANDILRTKIFPVLRNDEAVQSIRYDDLIIKFANRQAEKYVQHQHDMIRANLRLLGRFKMEIKKMDSSVNDFKNIYIPHMFDKCVNALRKVANWDANAVLFKTPAVAQNLTCLIKKCGKMQIAEYIKEGQADLKAEVEDFLLLWDDRIPSIKKKALEDLIDKKRIKKVVLPPIKDIKKLNLYLKRKIVKAIENLSATFCATSWTELTQATLIFVQIFNRRRAGEIERLTIQNFEAKELITDNIDKEILKNMSKETIRFAKQYARIILRGKLGRTVSVLLCPLSLKAVETILKYRLEAGIPSSNPYIFSKPTFSAISKQYLRACPLLKMFSLECGAKIPQSLRGTTLRKHIATYASLQNIEEASVDRLANFMGHHKDIHKSIYRMSVPVAEITCVSKLLMAAVGDEVEDEEDEEEELNFEEEKLNFEEENNFRLSKTKKKRSTSPFGKTKRSRWSDEEREAVNTAFGSLESLNKLPSLNECKNAILQSPALKNRTPQQIKTWVDNQRRYKMN